MFSSKLIFISALSLLFASSYILSGCNRSDSSPSTYESSGAYEPIIDESRSETEIKEDLAAREKYDPASYLSFEYLYSKNLFGEMVIDGSISSSATLAKFKDAEIEVVGYSKTDSRVGVWKETIYEVFLPGRKKKVPKIKMMLPKEVKSIRITIVDAKSVN